MDLVLAILAIAPAIVLIICFIVTFISFMGREGMIMIAMILISSVIIVALLMYGVRKLHILGVL